MVDYGITTDDTRGDVSSFSAAMVKDRLSNKTVEFQDEIARSAAARSDGLFLWVHLLRQELDPGENAKALRRIVSEMPEQIDQAYERDMDRLLELKGSKRARAMAVLRWVLFAVRPLSLRELAEALILDAETAALQYPSDELPDGWAEHYVDEDYVNSTIRRLCGSLIVLRRRHANEPLAFHTVHFVHFSVKEYLLRSSHDDPNNPKIKAICFPNQASEHDLLAHLCLQYLCYDIFGEVDKEKSDISRKIRVYPFLVYAAKSWHTHAVRDQCMSQHIQHYAEKLFNPATSNWQIWSRVFESEDGFDDYEGEDDDNSSYFESDDPEALLDQGIDYTSDASIEANDDHGSEDTSSQRGSSLEERSDPQLSEPASPIYFAACLGLTDIIKALQGLGLSCDTVGGRYGTPLQAAIVYGHESSAEYLLAQDVDVQRNVGYWGSAIGAAVGPARKECYKSSLKLAQALGLKTSTDGISYTQRATMVTSKRLALS